MFDQCGKGEGCGACVEVGFRIFLGKRVDWSRWWAGKGLGGNERLQTFLLLTMVGECW